MAFGGIRRLRTAAFVVMAAAVLCTSTAAASSSLTVSGQKTNGLHEPLGLGDGTPDFSWKLAGAGRTAKQSAYEIRVAASQAHLASGPYLWQSGKVDSSQQSSVELGGQPLPSRQPAAWQVRVWDAAGEVSSWSAPATFETGLLQQSDWGSAKWIELAGRNNTQPLPIFARPFAVDKAVKSARLYMSGLGLFEAQLNGSKLTDEVLAPGYTNYQLSAEYRAYDVTDELRGGANTLGVELGNGTANNIKMANPAVGRTNSFAWWNSTAVGSGTLTAPAAAGDTNVSVSSVANYYLGGAINIDTGDGGDRLESRTITAIGTAPATTTLAAPVAAGDSNVKLNSVSGMAVGGKLNIGSETKTINEVGTAAVNTTLAAATIVGEAPPPPPSLQGASWLWNVAGHSTNTPAGTIYVRRTFTVSDPAAVARAQLRINADDSHVTYVNGQQVAQSGGGNNAWQTSQIVDVKPRLVAGTNVIAVAATNAGGAGGLIGALELDSDRIVTDATWKALEGTPATPPAGWNTAAFDDSGWPAASSAGQYGIGPWNQNIQTPATPDPSVLRVAGVAGFQVGDTVIVDSGANLETRTVTAVGTAGANGTGITLNAPLTIVHAQGAPVRNPSRPGTGVTFEPALGQAYAEGAAVSTPGTGITFSPALDSAHAAGASVTGSGNPLAALDPSAGAMVTPRLIGRLEIAYADGSSDTVVTNRDWRAAFGPMVTDHWFGGTDYDARREQAGWTNAGADLSSSAQRRDGTEVGWRSAGIAPPPNLTTKLAARNAEPVKVQRTFDPVRLTNPQPGVWVFDFGQNFAGWPELRLPGGLPAGTVVKLQPAETLNANGTVNQSSIGVGGRGSDIFATYTTLGTPGGETWHPKFNYFGMQYLQVTGLPAGFTPTTDMIRGLQLFADVPRAGDVETSDERINRIHRMSYYSITSNTMSVFTDCPGREKLPYGADYVQPMGSLNVNFDYAAYLRNMQVQLVEGQSKAGPDAGNVALKTPVYDWGYSGQFGDEINWGSSIVQVPYLLYKLYGDTQTMRDHYDAMKTYMDFLARRKATDFIVTALLADWVASEQTSQQLLGTWGYYVSAKYMAEMAALTGRSADAAAYTQLAQNIRTAFNNRFFNTTLHRYTAAGNGGTAGATQTAQAVALDAGLVPEVERANVLSALVENIYAYQPFGGGPHFSGGTIGLAPAVRALLEAGRSDVLWDVMQEDTRPSYGFFMQPTAAHPEGLTTHPERWTLGDSQNHMILLQIEEWFHTGVAGIKQAPGSVAYRELIYKPTPVGDLTHAKGHYTTPQGTARSEWRRDATGITRFDVTVPANTEATVYVPATSAAQTFAATGSGDARYLRYEDGYQVYDVAAGDVTFLQGTSTDGTVGGTVPPTLSLAVGAPASFGAFAPGVDRNYETSMTATVTSTAGEATLAVTDPSSHATGRLVNGPFALSEPLQVRANSGAFAPLDTTAGSPRSLLTYPGPVSNDAVSIGFRQHIGADQPLRTGTYSKTLTFTLSTTTP
jgi:alpha-L-rhamnosidase